MKLFTEYHDLTFINVILSAKPISSMYNIQLWPAVAKYTDYNKQTLHTWLYPQDVHANYCGHIDWCVFFHLIRCRQIKRCRPFLFVVCLSSEQCLHGTVAAHPSCSTVKHLTISPSYLSDLMTATANIQLRKRLRSADTNRYEPFTTRLKFGEHCFSHAGPKAWNALPAELQDLTDHSAFKRQLKTFLFERAFTTWVSRRWSL